MLQGKFNFDVQLEKLHKRLLGKHKLYDTKQNGVNFINFLYDSDIVTAALSKSIKQEDYSFTYPLVSREIHPKNKKARFVYPLCITDRIVQGAIYKDFGDAQAHYLSKDVYSYIKKRGPIQAANTLSNYIKKIRYNTPKKATDIFVMHADVANYVDSVPVADRSLLWSRLEDLAKHLHWKVSPYIWSLIKSAIRPTLMKEDGNPYQFSKGIPTGVIFEVLCLNIYLKSLDDVLGKIPGAFYARYCDDLIFAHTDINIFKQTIEKIPKILNELKLELNPEKTKLTYLTTCGKKYVGDLPLEGSQYIKILGFCVNAVGDISVTQKSVRNLMRKIYTRLQNSARLLQNKTIHEKAHLLCQIANLILNRESELCEPTIKRIIHFAKDQKVLRAIDFHIALKISELCTGIRGTRTFRELSYRQIRREFKLNSLYQEINNL